MIRLGVSVWFFDTPQGRIQEFRIGGGGGGGGVRVTVKVRLRWFGPDLLKM